VCTTACKRTSEESRCQLLPLCLWSLLCKPRQSHELLGVFLSLPPSQHRSTWVRDVYCDTQLYVRPGDLSSAPSTFVASILPTFLVSQAPPLENNTHAHMHTHARTRAHTHTHTHTHTDSAGWLARTLLAPPPQRAPKYGFFSFGSNSGHWSYTGRAL